MTCSVCGAPCEGRRGRRGMCRPHYDRWLRYGNPTYAPPWRPRAPRSRPQRRAAEVLSHWALVRDLGGDLGDAAEGLDMTLDALEQALYRARKRGDDRGRLAA